jgi:hypothetical protein
MTWRMWGVCFARVNDIGIMQKHYALAMVGWVQTELQITPSDLRSTHVCISVRPKGGLAILRLGVQILFAQHCSLG